MSRHVSDPRFMQEVRAFAVDSLRGSEPSTVLGAISTAPAGITIAGIARRLGLEAGIVSGIVNMLVDEDLCETIQRSGEIRVVPFAAFSERNSHRYTAGPSA